MNVTIVWWG